MRWRAKLLLLCVSFTILEAVHSESISLKTGETHLLTAYASSGKFLHFIISNESLAKVPDWNGEGKVPLSKQAATKLVNDKYYKVDRGKEFRIVQIYLESQDANCKPGQKCPNVLWYYVVKIKGAKPETCVVMLNGDFVEPRKK